MDLQDTPEEDAFRAEARAWLDANAEPLASSESKLAVEGRLAGGTDEILRNIVAERILRLPPEPRADEGIPFADLPEGT